MLKIGIIGIGNCGSQNASLAFKEEQIPAIAINTSKSDLATVKSITGILIGTGDGSGKDRATSKEAFKKSALDLINNEELIKFINELDFVFVVVSTGGGTGSGLGPIFTTMLRERLRKKAILVVVAPKYSEGYGSQENSIQFFKELLTSMPDLTYMVYDNQKFAHMPSNMVLDEVNKDILDDLRILRGDYLPNTKYDSIDKEELTRLLTTPGRLATLKLYDIKEKDLDTKSIDELLLSGLRNTATAEIDRTRDFKTMGVISNLDERVKLKFNSDVPKVKEALGNPIEISYHDYVIENPKEEDNKVCIILGGLPHPNDRVSKIIEIAREIREKRANLASQENIFDEVDMDEFSSIRDGSKNLKSYQGNNKSVNSEDLDDLFGRFNC